MVCWGDYVDGNCSVPPQVCPAGEQAGPAGGGKAVDGGGAAPAGAGIQGAEQEKQKLESKMAEVEQFCHGLSKESNQHTIWSYGGSKRIDQRAEEPA